MKSDSIKRLVYWIIAGVIVLFTIEMSPYLVSPVLFGHAFSREQVTTNLIAQFNEAGNQAEVQEEENKENAYLGDHILHPYLGFVNVPADAYNRFNFPGPDPITRKNPDTINICLTGGSVALGLYSNAGNELVELLRQSDFMKDKEINLVVFALGGYKQPQQLLALSYFLSLGAQYDVVINLDGFNEIVLPYSDNLPFNVFPSYPRHWNIYSRKRLNSKVQLLLSKQISLKEEQHQLTAFFVKTHLYQSNFGLLLWNTMNNNKKSAQFKVEEQLRLAIRHSESDYQSTGPAETVTDTTQFFEEQAGLWHRSSVLMDALAQSNGFAYFHFLQPNQYVTGSKQLTEEELTIAYEHNPFAYKEAVQLGYPLLISHGEQLRDEGIHFLDLTQMFKNEKRTIYNDKCCHFNALGYGMIAEEMAEFINNYFDKHQSFPDNQ